MPMYLHTFMNLVRWAARRGSYRVLYAIDDQSGVVTVLAPEHRRDIYRQR